MSDNSLLKLCFVGGIIFLGMKIYKKNEKTIELSNKMENLLNEMEKKIEIGDTSFLVKDAVDRLVKKTAEEEIEEAISDINDDIREDVRTKINDSVNASYRDIKDMLEEELRRKIGSVSVESMRKSVISDAAEIAANKFQSDLDILIDKYNDDLGNVSKIYRSIAMSMSPLNNNPGLRLY